MAGAAPQPESDEKVQVFDVAEALERRDRHSGRVDMANSPNSYIAVFGVAPRHGETRVHSHPDSDQILFVLKGECTVEGLTGRYKLEEDQGVLIPAGVNYGFTNLAEDQLVFLSLRTEGSGGRRVAYVPSVPSDVGIKIPAAQIGAQGIGTHLYAYALDGYTIGISPFIVEEWNRACVLRMECSYEKAGDDIVAVLPERLAYWYRLSDLFDGDYKVIADPDGSRVQVDLTPAIDREVSRKAAPRPAPRPAAVTPRTGGPQRPLREIDINRFCISLLDWEGVHVVGEERTENGIRLSLANDAGVQEWCTTVEACEAFRARYGEPAVV
jgi:mannose-6-phosphate isomerase-like protein (cupin superfamily)